MATDLLHGYFGRFLLLTVNLILIMYERTLSLSDLELRREEIYLNAGYGGQTPDPDIAEKIEKILTHAAGLCRPRIGYGIFPGSVEDIRYLSINGVKMKVGSRLAGYYAKAALYAVFVVTAGEEFDSYLHQLRESGEMLDEFLADAIGSEIAEATVRFLEEEIRHKASADGMCITPVYSPGYNGWNVEEQKQLFSLLKEGVCGVSLTESSLMYPVKSVSGVIGIGADVEASPVACAICGLQSCFKRKTSY